ncbi:MAG: tRNA (adenosine(37)-N6)-threonylcarbamoyltransferase complex dimerization subunit type 1 TsaB [Lachnospiraceae bacterium]|nr:tRNA (adenosine(37)-N6)-threonylcarbamoyltransferase complex dimerization subunit type 1 TsaB [Lachnospiraceae bacterium]
MRLLAIESSGQLASVAVIEDGEILGMKVGEFKVTHSETLMPMIDAMLKEAGVELDSLDAIAVSGGPGSFTGLRIGSATAKGLGLALDIPLIHVPTLHAMTYNLLVPDYIGAIIVPMMDARRGQVYCGIYDFVIRPDNMVDFDIFMDADAMSVTDLLDRIKEITDLDGNPPIVVFLGDGVMAYHEVIEQYAQFNFDYAPDEAMLQRADTVALLGQLMYSLDMTVSADEEAPDYLRPSQAERERAEKENR